MSLFRKGRSDVQNTNIACLRNESSFHTEPIQLKTFTRSSTILYNLDIYMIKYKYKTITRLHQWHAIQNAICWPPKSALRTHHNQQLGINVSALAASELVSTIWIIYSYVWEQLFLPCPCWCHPCSLGYWLHLPPQGCHWMLSCPEFSHRTT